MLKACLWIDSLVLCQEDMPAEDFRPSDREASLVMDLAREACCFGDNDLGLAIANEFSKKYTCTMSHPLLSLAWDLFRHNHLGEANTVLASCQTESDNTASCRAEMHFLQGEIYAQQGLTDHSCQAAAAALTMEPANERYGAGALEKMLALCLETMEELTVPPNAVNMLEQQKTAYLGWKLKAQYIKEAVGHEKK